MEKVQGGDTESAGCDRGANRLCIMAPQPRSSPSNKFDNLLRVGGLGVLLTTVVAVPLSIPSFKQRASQKSD